MVSKKGNQAAPAGRGVGLHFMIRVRLVTGFLTGLVAFLLLDRLGLSGPMRLALAWDLCAATYLALSWVMMLRSTTELMTRRARSLDISLLEIVCLTLVAATFSLIAAFRVLGAAEGENASLHLVLGVATIFLSWAFVHTLFAIHYAHEFHDEDRKQRGKPKGGLSFPGDETPDYWDFVYFAAVIAMTCQVSDVTIDSRPMRHLVTAHGIISFFLNTVIVALAVGIAASLI